VPKNEALTFSCRAARRKLLSRETRLPIQVNKTLKSFSIFDFRFSIFNYLSISATDFTDFSDFQFLITYQFLPQISQISRIFNFDENTSKQAFDELRPGFEGATLRSINNAKLNNSQFLIEERK